MKLQGNQAVKAVKAVMSRQSNCQGSQAAGFKSIWKLPLVEILPMTTGVLFGLAAAPVVAAPTVGELSAGDMYY